MDLMLKRTISSFYGITSIKDKDNILLTEDIVSIDLNEYFHIADNTLAELIVGSLSNPNILDYEIIGRNLILNKTDIEGFSELKILAKVPDKDAYVQTSFNIINPTSLIEDFEIASLEDSKITWIPSGDAKWFVTDGASYFNKKSIRSGEISAGQTSGINLSLDLFEPGTLIFAYKTSTRPFYDKLNFYIDGVNISEMESLDLWSGLNEWRVLSYNIRAGIRNIKWEYVRGPYVPYNEDIVWLDMIVIPDKFNNKYTFEDPEVTQLSNYPNPFNPSTEIKFSLDKNGEAELFVFDIKGRQVAEIYCGNLQKGFHSFRFDGNSLSSGIYYSVLKYGNKIFTNKMILAK